MENFSKLEMTAEQLNCLSKDELIQFILNVKHSLDFLQESRAERAEQSRAERAERYASDSARLSAGNVGNEFISDEFDLILTSGNNKHRRILGNEVRVITWSSHDKKGTIKKISDSLKTVYVLMSSTTTGCLTEFTLRSDGRYVEKGYSKDLLSDTLDLNLSL